METAEGIHLVSSKCSFKIIVKMTIWPISRLDKWYSTENNKDRHIQITWNHLTFLWSHFVSAYKVVTYATPFIFFYIGFSETPIFSRCTEYEERKQWVSGKKCSIEDEKLQAPNFTLLSNPQIIIGNSLPFSKSYFPMYKMHTAEL